MIYAELYLKDDFFKILRQTKSLLNSKTIYIKSLSLLTTFISALHNSLQGDPNQNLKFVLAITLKISISDPIIMVTPKCVYLHFSAICLQFLKINLHLTNTFWLYQHRVINAYFLVIAKTNFKFWYGSPCRFGTNLSKRSDKKQKSQMNKRPHAASA